MYIVRASNHSGAVSFACGTPDQAIDKAAELLSRGFTDVKIKDLTGQSWSPAVFAGRHGLD